MNVISSQGSSLLSVDLSASEVGDSGLAALKDCKNLQSLNFDFCELVSDVGLDHLTCNHLYRFQIFMVQVLMQLSMQCASDQSWFFCKFYGSATQSVHAHVHTLVFHSGQKVCNLMAIDVSTLVYSWTCYSSCLSIGLDDIRYSSFNGMLIPFCFQVSQS